MSFEPLFEPIEIGNVTLKNRIAMSLIREPRSGVRPGWGG